MADTHRRLDPVLVTGTHRSGTTWIGRMLALSGELASVHEPFNPTQRWSWLSERPAHWYEYVTADTAAQYDNDIQRLIDLRYPFATMAKRVRTPRNAAAVVRDGSLAFSWRRSDRTLLMKDPIAFFAAPWLAEQYGIRPLVCVRHPAAFVSSLKRLGWRMSLSNWTEQPDLLNGPLSAWVGEIEKAANSSDDIVDHGILIWRIMNDVVRRDYASRSGWRVLRYEDYAADPAAAFPQLYRELGLTWNTRAAKALDSFTSTGGQGEVGAGEHMSVRRDSTSAMWTWLDRLSSEEIDRVRVGTADVAEHFYCDDDWQRS